MNRAELADFLRTRRQAVQPEDAGLPRTRRRRTGGLRREEVAELSNMSTDYYSRIEQQRGPRPSEQMLAAIARALRLDPQERDHLFHLADHPTPQRVTRTDHVNPGMWAIFQRMQDTPAVIFNQLGETLAQNPLSILLLRDQTTQAGPSRALAYRWFTDPAERALFPEQDHARHGRTIAEPKTATRPIPASMLSSTRYDAAVRNSRRSGANTRSPAPTARPSASSTLGSAPLTCTARACSTPTSPSC
jgi:transcriptional regulator with XRE-family HTH domain